MSNPYRQDGLGWLSAAFVVVGLASLVVRQLELDVWVLSPLGALPPLFSLVLLVTGVALALAGLFARDEVDEEPGAH